MSGMQEVLKTVYIETEREAYRGFFDHDWARRWESDTQSCAKVNRAFSDLALSWKETSNAFRFPWLLPRMHQKFVEGFFESSDSIALDLVRLLKTYVARRSVEEGNTAGAKFLTEIADDLQVELVQGRRQLAAKIRNDDGWERYIQDKEFILSISGLVDQTYKSVYSAYDHFVLQSYRLRTSDRATRTATHRFEERFKQAFGKNLADRCWTSDVMQMHREVRNALTHNGGHLTDRLKKWRSKLHVVDGRVSVGPTEIRDLYGLLAGNAEALCESLLGKSPV